jgi:hypothetical protein
MRDEEPKRKYPNGYFMFKHEGSDGETSTRLIPYSDVTLDQLVEEIELFINGLGYSSVHLEWEYTADRAEREKLESKDRQMDLEPLGLEDGNDGGDDDSFDM